MLFGLSACDSTPPKLMKASKQFDTDERRDQHVAYMRTNHMDVLMHKRDETMYDGIRTKKGSLKACINCHVPEEHNGECHVDHPVKQDKTASSAINPHSNNPHITRLEKPGLPVDLEVVSENKDLSAVHDLSLVHSQPAESIGQVVSGGTAAAVTIAPGVFLREVQAKPADEAIKDTVRWGMLVDINKLTDGGDSMIAACKKEHGWGNEPESNDAQKAQWIRKVKVTEKMTGHTMSLPVMCQHCETAPCVDVCPTGASMKRADGIVQVNKHICIGCRYCMMACPYKARSFVHETLVDQLPDTPRGKGTVESCNLCVNRVDEGKNPACVEAAPQATLFGDLNDPNSKISQALKKYGGTQIRADLGYWTVLGLFGLLVLAGAGAFVYMHDGHYVTGMNNQVVWGMPHVFAIFLIVAASGAANIATIGTVFGKKIYQPLGRLSAFLAAALLVGGLIVLLLDLGSIGHVIEMAYGALNFKSIFAWNMILYSGFIAIIGVYLWSMMDRRKTAKALYKPTGIANMVWRFMLTMGTGSIFGFLVARQYYDAAILAPLFIVASYVFGTAIYILVLMASFKMTGRELGDSILNRLRNTLAIFIALVLFFELARHLTNLYATEHHGVEKYILTGGGKFTNLFWYGQIIMGSLVPMFLVWCRFLKNNRTALVVAAMLAILGGLIQIYVILIGGQSFPLVLFPNAEVSSTFFDGVNNAYTATAPEYILGIGGVGLAMVLLILGMKVLRLLPTTLADSVADPHHKN
ncbi:Hdr-like menaquinol oxidoreductase iron-sulfur subunit 1 [Nymphon striatum]|nr:Hdr-like menaquinol oxidoreductase iron-sulfur subunit 1 [Nymphon striatum]